MTTDDAVTVFTAKNKHTILREHGSEAWKLDPARARKCTWLVCTQNAHNSEDYADSTEPHRSAFLLGRISRITPAEAAGRWRVEFSEYAELSIPDVWAGDRNPVRYTSLAALGIDPAAVQFTKVSDPDRRSASAAAEAPEGLTIAEAKSALAARYAVPADRIEIIIRG